MREAEHRGRDAGVHVIPINAPHVVDGAEPAARTARRGDALGIVEDVRGIAGRLSDVRRLIEPRGDALDAITLGVRVRCCRAEKSRHQPDSKPTRHDARSLKLSASPTQLCLSAGAVLSILKI